MGTDQDVISAEHASPTGGSGSGDIAVHWLDPRTINLVYGTVVGARRQLYHGRHQESLDGDWDLDVRAEPFSEYPLFRGLHERFVQGRSWEHTEYLSIARKYVDKRIEAGKVQKGDRETAVRTRLDSLDALYREIRDSGYKSQRELAGDPDATVAASSNEDREYDEIRVAINRSGQYMSIDGRHRLAIARLLGIEKVPVNVVARHAEWEQFRAEILAWATEHHDRVYQQIDHPDLEAIPAGHHDDRVPLLLRALEGYDPAGKTIVDIGAHWGHMTQQMERLGFKATAVEHHAENIYFMEKLRDATGCSFDIFHGSIFDFPEPEEMEVILALNVLHHLTRSWENHDRLIQFLRRIRPELILFESHRAPHVSQMKEAFRNYSPWEFADFVGHHSGLTNFELMGSAADGRLIFKFWR